MSFKRSSLILGNLCESLLCEPAQKPPPICSQAGGNQFRLWRSTSQMSQLLSISLALLRTRSQQLGQLKRCFLFLLGNRNQVLFRVVELNQTDEQKQEASHLCGAHPAGKNTGEKV